MKITFSLSDVRKKFPVLNSQSTNFKLLQNNIQNKLKKKNLKLKKYFFFSKIGKIKFPYFSMGNINSTDLFSANEFIIFYLYYIYKKKNIKALDLGANLGLHTIILNKLGYSVTSYEPDPFIFKRLRKNILENKCKKVHLKNLAIFDKSTKLKFTRVINNLTGSHISTEKKSYGKKNYITVKTQDIRSIIKNFDLIKMDIESAEARVLIALKKLDFKKKIFIIEIGNKNNAKKIFYFLKKKKINFFSQKNNFKKIKIFKQMPQCHQDGALIIKNN